MSEMKLPDIAAVAEVQTLVKQALSEDLGAGDVTTLALIDASTTGRGVIVARQDCVVAGAGVASHVFRSVDAEVTVRVAREDGTKATAGEEILSVTGPVRAILAGERTALNFLQRMCGIATLTDRFVEKVRSYNVAILDTRKTTPGHRALEKYAVLCGGGTNHRMGLDDMALIKDNHKKYWVGSVASAVTATREKYPDLMIEVEVESEEELRDVLVAKPDRILLDNMTPEMLAQCVAVVGGKATLEASGGITLKNVEAVAATGVNAVSLGCLTHSAPSIDIALDIEESD